MRALCIQRQARTNAYFLRAGMLPCSQGLPGNTPAMTVQRRCLQEERRAAQIQAATWRSTAGEKGRELALISQHFEELRRRDVDRQRHVDRLLTGGLQMELKLQAMGVRSDDWAGAVVCVHALCYHAGVSSNRLPTSTVDL